MGHWLSTDPGLAQEVGQAILENPATAQMLERWRKTKIKNLAKTLVRLQEKQQQIAANKALLETLSF